MSSNRTDNAKVNSLVKILPPQPARICWIPNSGNQVALDVCKKIFDACDGSNRRILLVDGVGGSGLSYLLLAFERSLRRNGNRVLTLLEGVVEDEGSLLSNLTAAVGVPFSVKRSREISDILASVLKLRRIDAVIIHDFQRFTSIEGRQSCANLDALLYLLALMPKCKFILGGTSSSLELVGLLMAAHIVERVSLQSMDYDQNFISFVDHLAALYANDLNGRKVDAKAIHAITGGLVGETAIQVRLMVSHA
ncbi:hypothetical protein ACK56M_13900 [Pseudomonas sp. s4]|uniref:hypothetical protein n=1 Tax=Pseudomonas sp. s4 TaxID=353218 RepID=UPI00398D560B